MWTTRSALVRAACVARAYLCSVTVRSPSIARRRGFTYIELIAVIALLSLLSLLAYPLFSAGSEMRLELAAEMVKADIQFTQRLAMSDGASRSAVFTAGAGTYTYGSGGTQARSRNLTRLVRPVSIGSTQTITFNSLGEPYIDADTRITVSGAAGWPVTLTIISHTGKVMVNGP